MKFVFYCDAKTRPVCLIVYGVEESVVKKSGHCLVHYIVAFLKDFNVQPDNIELLDVCFASSLLVVFGITTEVCLALL